MNRRRDNSTSFRSQMRQSMSELQAIMDRQHAPLGGGQYTVHTVQVIQPASYNSKSVRALRRSLHLSQALFAQLVGVSSALVRAWELGTRVPAPVARRLMDQMRTNPSAFAAMIVSTQQTRAA